jgi:hypothetical protein
MLARMWGKRTLLHCWWECKVVQSLWKTVWKCLKKLKVELPCDPAIPLLGIYLRNVNQVTIKAPAHPCLLQHYSQQLSCGNSQDAPLLKNGSRKCVIYTQWNFTQPWRMKLSFAGKWMELENIILSEFSQVQKAKGHMFSLICEIQT